MPKLRSFQGRLERRFRSDNSVDPQIRSHIPFENKSKEELVDSIKRIKSQEEELKKCNFFLKCDLERLQKRSKLWRDELKKLSRTSKDSFSSIATKVERTIKNCSAKGKEVILSILKTICENIPKKKKGRRHIGTEGDAFSELMEVTLILGGPRVCVFVADDLQGPHIDQVKRWHQRLSFKYDFQNFQENMKYIAKLYENIKRKLDIKEKIPYLKIEDETAIEPRPEYDQRLNIVWGYCGLREAHFCEDFYAINVSDDQGAYEQLVEDMNNSKLATMARAIIVNPLHTSLPRIVLHLQGTCNAFTHETVLRQWNMYDLLCKEFLDPVLGPGIGNGSDGDSRQRKLFLAQSSDLNNGQRAKGEARTRNPWITNPVF